MPWWKNMAFHIRIYKIYAFYPSSTFLLFSCFLFAYLQDGNTDGNQRVAWNNDFSWKPFMARAIVYRNTRELKCSSWLFSLDELSRVRALAFRVACFLVLSPKDDLVRFVVLSFEHVFSRLYNRCRLPFLTSSKKELFMSMTLCSRQGPCDWLRA